MGRYTEELSQMIVEKLSNRKGFEDWWYGLEDDIQEEVLDDIKNTYDEWIDGGEIVEDEENEALM